MIRIIIYYFLICSFCVSPAYSKSKVETMGDILQIALPSAAFGMTYYSKDKNGRSKFYKSAVTVLAITYALKYVVEDERPNGSDKRAFISGHTAAAFLGTSFLQRRYGWKFGVLYAASSFVGWSRIKSKNHELNDVIRGGVIGVAVTCMFTKRKNKDLAFTPLLYRDTYGLDFSYKW